MLEREAWQVGKKRMHRLYRLEGLQLRMKVRRRKRIALLRGEAGAVDQESAVTLACRRSELVHDAAVAADELVLGLLCVRRQLGGSG
jgi:hypothetical protein